MECLIEPLIGPQMLTQNCGGTHYYINFYFTFACSPLAVKVDRSTSDPPGLWLWKESLVDGAGRAVLWGATAAALSPRPAPNSPQPLLPVWWMSSLSPPAFVSLWVCEQCAQFRHTPIFNYTFRFSLSALLGIEPFFLLIRVFCIPLLSSPFSKTHFINWVTVGLACVGIIHYMIMVKQGVTERVVGVSFLFICWFRQ